MSITTIPADTILYNGAIHSFDHKYTTYQAMAIKDGYITKLGNDSDIITLAGEHTQKIDLQGKTVIPGLIDSHMHPYWGAKSLMSFTLNYTPYSNKELIAHLSEKIAKDAIDDNHTWLHVRGWLRRPNIDLTCHDLDTIDTKRPIILFSNNCHFIALNSRGLALMGISKDTPNPTDGNILHDIYGEPTGIIEDGPAMRIYDEVSKVSTRDASQMLLQAQKVFHQQGVTSVMDTRADYEGFDAGKLLEKEGTLAIRIMGAREITPDDCPCPENAEKAIEQVVTFADTYNGASWSPSPSVDVTHIKLFIDGILSMKTAFIREPYYENFGTEEQPEWKQGNNVSFPYISQDVANSVILAAAKQGLHIHTHTIASGAIDLILNAIEGMRKVYPEKDIRVGMAHVEHVDLPQYVRFARLHVHPVVSFQWCGMSQEMHDLTKNLLGSQRFKEGCEPQGRFFDAGAHVAFGSDWPIDPFDEWFDFQIACTRRLPHGVRTDSDRNLTMKEVITAATRHAAEAVAKERYIGSLECGKFADFAVLDRDVFTIDPETISETKVVLTAVGGKIVYEA